MQDNDENERCVKDEKSTNNRPLPELNCAIDGINSKYSDVKDLPGCNKSEPTPMPSSSGPSSLLTRSSGIHDVNGHSTAPPSLPPSNMFFPAGKFFGLFPRIGTNVDDQLQVGNKTFSQALGIFVCFDIVCHLTNLSYHV